MNCWKCPVNWDCEIDEDNNIPCGCEIGIEENRVADILSEADGAWDYWKED